MEDTNSKEAEDREFYFVAKTEDLSFEGEKGPHL